MFTSRSGKTVIINLTQLWIVQATMATSLEAVSTHATVTQTLFVVVMNHHLVVLKAHSMTQHRHSRADAHLTSKMHGTACAGPAQIQARQSPNAKRGSGCKVPSVTMNLFASNCWGAERHWFSQCGGIGYINHTLSRPHALEELVNIIWLQVFLFFFFFSLCVCFVCFAFVLFVFKREKDLKFDRAWRRILEFGKRKVMIKIYKHLKKFFLSRKTLGACL